MADKKLPVVRIEKDNYNWNILVFNNRVKACKFEQDAKDFVEAIYIGFKLALDIGRKDDE